MRAIFVSLLLISSVATAAETPKCSPENLEILAKGYKKFLQSDILEDVNELKALIELQKQADKFTSKEVMKKVFAVKKDSKTNIDQQKTLMAQLEKLETEHPECFFK